jgi:outer membrane protein insertion porin family
VIVKLTPLTGDQFVIVFRPARAEPAVAEVAFEGNQVIPSAMLQNAISEAAIGAPYHEDKFRQLLDAAIRPLYDARGRIRVSFPKVAVQNAQDVQGLAVKVTVDEGVTYDLGSVRIEGADGFRPEDLLKSGKFQSGDLANFNDVGKGIDRIKKMLKHQGYLRNEIEIVRKIDDSTKKVDLVLRVNEGPQYLFGALTVEGLDLNGEAAFKKMWTLKEGKPYNPDYADYFLGRVREEAIFDNLGETRSESKINEQAHTVDVTVYLKGGTPSNNPKKRREF